MPQNDANLQTCYFEKERSKEIKNKMSGIKSEFSSKIIKLLKMEEMDRDQQLDLGVLVGILNGNGESSDFI